MNEAYVEGFVAKCASAGIDAESLVKESGISTQGIGRMAAKLESDWTKQPITLKKLKDVLMHVKGVGAKRVPSVEGKISGSGGGHAFQSFNRHNAVNENNMLDKIKYETSSQRPPHPSTFE